MQFTNNSRMDLDLTEYDQFDEIKFLTNKDQQQHHEGPSSILVTLSSSSSEPSASSHDDTNCENDYVFLPSPPSISTSSSSTSKLDPPNKQQTAARSHSNQPSSRLTKAEGLRASLETGTDVASLYGHQQRLPNHPLMTINSNGGNPFCNLQQVSPDSVQLPPAPLPLTSQQPSWLRPISETLSSKPIGVLDISANVPSNPNHVAALMHQIITKSDSIYIAIPCDYCLEPVACPPSDISAWLNHMSGQHNCKVCPVCNKLVGLGPRRDLEIIRRHVMGHFDDDWLERRALKTNFTHGLQQYWFSGGRCTIKEPRSLGAFAYNRD